MIDLPPTLSHFYYTVLRLHTPGGRPDSHGRVFGPRRCSKTYASQCWKIFRTFYIRISIPKWPLYGGRLHYKVENRILKVPLEIEGRELNIAFKKSPSEIVPTVTLLLPFRRRFTDSNLKFDSDHNDPVTWILKCNDGTVSLRL